MRTIAGPNTNALRSITGYNVGSPLRVTTTPIPARPVQPIPIAQPQPQLRNLSTPQTNTGGSGGTGGGKMSAGQAMGAVQGAMALGTDINAIAKDQIPAQSAKGEGGRILGETAKYAAMGMAFGPIGAGVGALVGLTVGLVKNKKAKDAYKEQMAENKEIDTANKAQAALAANVNAQKAPATMKSPNERNMAPNKRTEPLKRTMAPIKMAPLKKELSSIQASSSYMRTPASAIERQEIMRTISGVSALKRSTGTTESGKKFIKSETNQTTAYDDGSDRFKAQYEEAKRKEQIKADNEAKKEYAKNNPDEAAKVSTQALKGKSEEEKAKIIADYRAKKSESEKQLAKN